MLGARETAQWLRAISALREDPIQLAAAATSIGSQSTATPAPGDPILSFWLLWAPTHMCHTLT